MKPPRNLVLRIGRLCGACVAMAWFSLSCLGQGTLQIGFDAPPLQPPGTSYFVQQYFESGMWFRPLGVVEPGNGFSHRRGGGQLAGVVPDNATSYLAAAFGDSLKFSFLNDSLFGVSSVDLAGYSSVVPDFSIRFVGYRPDGSMVTADFSGSGLNFRTFYFGSEFSGLSRVETSDIGWSLDNLVVSIPEPDAWALLMLGGGVTWLPLFARKQKLKH